MGAEYMGKTFSDHNLLQMQLEWGAARLLVPSWGLQPAVLEDHALRAEKAETLTHYFAESWGTSTSKLMDWEAMKVVLRGHFIRAVVGARATTDKDLTQVEASLKPLETAARDNHTKLTDLNKALVTHTPDGAAAVHRL
ncbi:hypothetical protein NDU88_000488 [Pleurodeles waltl]|uniref:Uncharacterized protein n=1 Tax=Pleurodeles waltl TaxID=8319 RepID=A0AAV7TF92_PLEWA|nr:hypothetical protein NDU88_000488 [Pleurodeles waltl]